VWEWAKEHLATEEINKKLLLGADKEGRTAWHFAGNGFHLDAFEKLW
jgi:hypothetical protein